MIRTGLLAIAALLVCELALSQFQQNAFWRSRACDPNLVECIIQGPGEPEDPEDATDPDGDFIWSNPIFYPAGSVLLVVAYFDPSNNDNHDVKAQIENLPPGAISQVLFDDQRDNHFNSIHAVAFLIRLGANQANPRSIRLGCDDCGPGTKGTVYLYKFPGMTDVDSSERLRIATPSAPAVLSDTVTLPAPTPPLTLGQRFFVVTSLAVPDASYWSPIPGLFTTGASTFDVAPFSIRNWPGSFLTLGSGITIPFASVGSTGGTSGSASLSYSPSQTAPRLIYFFSLR